MVDRPSYRELDLKLKQATEAASAKRIRLLDPDIILADLLELDYLVGDLVKDLPAIFRQIKPAHYIGLSPPDKSYKEPILNRLASAFPAACCGVSERIQTR